MIRNGWVGCAPFQEAATFWPRLAEAHILTFRVSLSTCEMGRCLPGRSIMRSCLWELRGAPVPLALSLSGLWPGMDGGYLMVHTVATGRARVNLILLLGLSSRLNSSLASLGVEQIWLCHCLQVVYLFSALGESPGPMGLNFLIC